MREKGFTLVEILVVIVIIAILAVLAVVIFRGVTISANDSRRKSDLNSIANAYEIKYQNSGQYQALVNTDFSSGSIPKTPEGGSYTCLVGPDSNCLTQATDKVAYCVSLGDNKSAPCFSNSGICYCTSTIQGSTLLVGGGGGSSCDPFGILTTGLAGWWKMDEGAGASITDSSGHTLTGNLTGSTGSTWTAGSQCKSGSCLYFDGVNTQVSIPNAPIFTPANNWSVSFWSKIDPTQTTWQGAFTLANSGSAWGIYASHGTNQPFIYTATGGTGATNLYFFGNSLTFSNDWKYYTLTRSGSTYTWYINGALNSTQNKGAGDVTLNTTSTWIMGFSYALRYKGFLDDVRVYNRALSASEVSGLYNNGNGCFP